MRGILSALALCMPLVLFANDKFTIIEPDEVDWQFASQFGAWTVNLVGAPDQEGLYIQPNQVSAQYHEPTALP